MGMNAQNPERSLLVKKVEKEITLDGRLNEDFWLKANSANDFWQMFPTDSLKSINKTFVRVLFNDTHLLIGVEAFAVD
jgi:hypothetical protein|tara:strand:+ start:5492 stop:5725 length:234 start_codon:yes stop_codon:yes gene_type:complete